MAVVIDGTSGITTSDIESTTSTLGPLTQALNLGSTGQIVFPATQNASSNANTLDDYEEGTFTPVFFGTSTAGTFTPGVANGGRYIKIGTQVTCWMNLNGTLSGAAGDMRISGLPFAVATTAIASNAAYSTGALQYWAGISVSPMGPLTVPGTTVAYFHTYQGASAGASGASPVVVNGSLNCHCFVTYYTD